MLMRKNKSYLQWEKHKSKANKIEQKSLEKRRNKEAKQELNDQQRSRKAQATENLRMVKGLVTLALSSQIQHIRVPFQVGNASDSMKRRDQNDQPLPAPLVWWSTHLIRRKNTFSKHEQSQTQRDFPCNCPTQLST